MCVYLCVCVVENQLASEMEKNFVKNERYQTFFRNYSSSYF